MGNICTFSLYAGVKNGLNVCIAHLHLWLTAPSSHSLAQYGPHLLLCCMQVRGCGLHACEVFLLSVPTVNFKKYQFLSEVLGQDYRQQCPQGCLGNCRSLVSSCSSSTQSTSSKNENRGHSVTLTHVADVDRHFGTILFMRMCR